MDKFTEPREGDIEVIRYCQNNGLTDTVEHYCKIYDISKADTLEYVLHIHHRNKKTIY